MGRTFKAITTLPAAQLSSVAGQVADARAFRQASQRLLDDLWQCSLPREPGMHDDKDPVSADCPFRPINAAEARKTIVRRGHEVRQLLLCRNLSRNRFVAGCLAFSKEKKIVNARPLADRRRLLWTSNAAAHCTALQFNACCLY